MSSLTQPLKIKKEFLPQEILDTIDDTLESLARQCADQWENSLRKDGFRLSPGDHEELIRHLKHEADVTLSLSVKITEKKLHEEWLISPISFSQNTLADYTPAEERESRIRDVRELAATLTTEDIEAIQRDRASRKALAEGDRLLNDMNETLEKRRAAAVEAGVVED